MRKEIFSSDFKTQTRVELFLCSLPWRFCEGFQFFKASVYCFSANDDLTAQRRFTFCVGLEKEKASVAKNMLLSKIFL
jgi:hypothetical protein